MSEAAKLRKDDQSTTRVFVHSTVYDLMQRQLEETLRHIPKRIQISKWCFKDKHFRGNNEPIETSHNGALEIPKFRSIFAEKPKWQQLLGPICCNRICVHKQYIMATSTANGIPLVVLRCHISLIANNHIKPLDACLGLYRQLEEVYS